MSRESVIFERLGKDGLVVTLEDLLDRTRLVRLANACGLKYPGSRTTSQTRQRIVADLADRAEEEDATRRTIHRALQKETRVAARRWNALAVEEKARLLGDQTYLLSRGNLGLHLYLLASTDGDQDQVGFETLLAQQQLLRLAMNGRRARAGNAKPSRSEARLRKQVTEFEKKVLHLEGQLAKSRETEKGTQQKWIQSKGELAECRMLAERLQRELSQLRNTVAKSVAAPASGALGDMGKAIKTLTTQQRKLTYRIEKLPASRQGADEETLAPLLVDPIKALHKEMASLRRDTRRELQDHSRSLEDLGKKLAAAREAAAKARRAPVRPRPKPGTERVGVFVDVQNMYYGARQLKGKLDFDALLQAAVRDRRRIQATAYVVESKEIDQSGFIALLQQRGIEVRRKTVQVRADGSRKGDWDMELALEMLEAAPDLDVAVLVSGDGDFTSLVKRIRRMGPRVEVIGFPRNTAKSLVAAADHFEPLDRKFMIYPKRSQAKSANATGP